MNAILVVICVVALTLFGATVFKGMGAAMLLNPEALIIVCGGTIAAVLIGFPFKRIKSTLRDIAEAFGPTRDRPALTRDVLDIARAYRKTDIRGIEKKMHLMKDDFLRVGVSLLINHQGNEIIRNVMERELSIRVMNSNFSQNVLKTIARLTPSFGLAGTVISLIRMFREAQSVETIAPIMAVAMISTFYGVIISSLFMLPLCAKLKEHAIESEALMHLAIEGIEAINNGEHPLRIEERLNGYCDPYETALPDIGSRLVAAKGEPRL